MGDRGDSVTVAPFCLDLTEVTADAYAACVKTGACTDEAFRLFGCNERQGGTYGISGLGKHPINCVSWGVAASYCRALGKRLPTEEEWEWAARGGDEARKYPWGNAEPSRQLCWSRLVGSDRTCAVGSFPKGNGRWGLLDMAGNVWDWTSSAYDSSRRVLRGGAWNQNFAFHMRAAHRAGFPPAASWNDVGFRCAR